MSMAASTDIDTFGLVLEQLDEPWNLACECDHREEVDYHQGAGEWVGVWCPSCGPMVLCAALHDACVAKRGITCPHGSFPNDAITFTPLNEGATS